MPRRRCVGCGRIAPKSELVRIALARGGDGPSRRAVVDSAGTLPGRGAYLCGANCSDQSIAPNPDCLRRAERSRGIARGLRSAATLDHKLVESAMSVAQPAEGRLAETGTDWGDTRYARIPKSTSAEGACPPASVEPLAISKS